MSVAGFEKPVGITNREDIRFRFNESGRELIEVEIEHMHKLQEAFPWFIGVTLFGSTTKASAVINDIHTSDVDVYYFYDSSKISNDSICATLSQAELKTYEKLQKDGADTSFTLVAKTPKSETARRNILGVTQPKSHAYGNSSASFFVDVSEQALTKMVNDIVNVLDGTKTPVGKNPHFYAAASAENLSKLFHLMPEHCLVEQRRFVLDALEKDTHGEKAFKEIMYELGRKERPKYSGEVTYAHYPASIAEAKNYFDC